MIIIKIIMMFLKKSCIHRNPLCSSVQSFNIEVHRDERQPTNLLRRRRGRRKYCTVRAKMTSCWLLRLLSIYYWTMVIGPLAVVCCHCYYLSFDIRHWKSRSLSSPVRSTLIINLWCACLLLAKLQINDTLHWSQLNGIHPSIIILWRIRKSTTVHHKKKIKVRGAGIGFLLLLNSAIFHSMHPQSHSFTIKFTINFK